MIRDIPPLSEVEAAVARCAWVADEFVASNTAELNVAPGPPTILDRRRKVFGTTGFHHIDYRVTLSLPPSAAHADPYADGIASVRVLTRGGTGRRWLIWVHGAAQGRSDDLYAFRAAHLHSRLGYDVVFPVLPAHGSRRMKQIAYPGFDPLRNVLMTMRAVAEIRSLIRWIDTHQPSEITIAGTSLGGPIAALVLSLIHI